MKTFGDYLDTVVAEDAAPGNVVGDGTGAVKLMQKPLAGGIDKRKPPMNVDDLGSVAKPTDDGVTKEDSDEDKKRMFRLKQDAQSNYSI